jgi:urease accessory protein
MPEDGRFPEGRPVRMQRARGSADVVLAASGGVTRIADLYQAGSAKAFLPRVHGPVPEVVFLNTSGGLTGGDRISFALTLGKGTRAVGTTQTAERAYSSAAGRAELAVSLTVGPGAALDWLPQETILFDRSALGRTTRAELAPDARFVMVEMVALGRAAMGETLQKLDFTDWREVRRAGVPVLVEPLRLATSTLGAGPAALGGQRAVATVALVAQGAEDALASLRELKLDGVEHAASAWNGKLVLRLLGPDLRPVKQAVARALRHLRGQPLPRVWQL